MLEQFLKKAAQDKPVFINKLEEYFNGLEEFRKQRLTLCLEDLEGRKRSFPMVLPRLNGLPAKEIQLVQDFLAARVYNILSSLGGRAVTFVVENIGEDKTLMEILYSFPEMYGLNLSRKERRGYGLSLNVIERMMEALTPDNVGFTFKIADKAVTGIFDPESNHNVDSSCLSHFQEASLDLGAKRICGIDVGGTDIKLCVSEGDRIICFKEYDWFPALFTQCQQLVDPMVNLIRLLRGYMTLKLTDKESSDLELEMLLEDAMDREAGEELINRAADRFEAEWMGELLNFDGIGICFPDVVIRNKIVGGEVYKTRGIRKNPSIDYEEDFKKLTHLDEKLEPFCNVPGRVKICNDGPMASFTAAVELAASPRAPEVELGNYAHTLGTELGTGWVNEHGQIPEIPLEVYNFIIDLGCNSQKDFRADDVRSLRNFNTGLPGTLQKYTCQSGVFRLAVKYFTRTRPDLLQELYDRRFISRDVDGIYLVTSPVDNRKAFLEYMMSLPEKDDDPLFRRIWEEVGEALAVTWLETEKLMTPKAKSRTLFGRLVKGKVCFDLMLAGARRVVPDIKMEIADGSLAYTTLMKELDAHPDYTVAQFAQAVGAVYFANT